MLEIARMCLFLAMFAVLAWFDFRDREISGLIFLVFGAAGAVLYAFDWHEVSSTDLYVVAITSVAIIAIWKTGLFGTGDMFAAFAGLVIYPIYYWIVPTIMPVFMGGWVLSFIFILSWNASLNASDVLRRGSVFSDVSDGTSRKFVAFFTIHRQRSFEKNAFIAEETVGGRRRLKLGKKDPDQEFVSAGVSKYVEYACPLMLFTAAAAFILLLAGHHIVTLVT